VTPEARLLVVLARGRASDSDGKRACALADEGVDWPRVLRLARAHEVVPLVHANVERFGISGVPAGVRDALEAGRRVVAARNALLRREQAQLLRVLTAAGLPAISMKGVTLAETLYGDPGLRDCSDIDVLVPRTAARDALRVLRESGYRSEFDEPFFETFLLRGHIECTLTRRTHDFEYVVDLHWGIGWNARPDRRAAEALWADSLAITREGVDSRAMTPEWELLTLVVHAARHRWEPIKWLIDIHDYCDSQRVDWAAFRDLSTRFDWHPAVEQTFAACAALLGTPTPAGVRATALAAHMPLVDRASPRPTPEALLPLPVIGRLSEKFRYVVKQLLVPTLAERRVIRLPPELQLFYYPMRPVRLGGKWGWRLLRRGARRFAAHRASS
jgi:hypothetical protein